MTSADLRRPMLRWGVAGGGRRGVLRRADSEAAEVCSVPHGGVGGRCTSMVVGGTAGGWWGGAPWATRWPPELMTVRPRSGSVADGDLAAIRPTRGDNGVCLSLSQNVLKSCRMSQKVLPLHP